MLLHTLSLQDFIRPTPICSGGVGLLAALELCQRQAAEQLIVVDDRHQPIGLLSLSQVLALWLQAEGSEAGEAFWHQTLWDLVEAGVAVTALTPVPVRWSVAQLVAQLTTASDGTDVVLMDRRGYCLGLVDEAALWRSLAQLVLAEAPSAVPPPAPDLAESLSGPEPQQIVQLTQQLLAQRAELEQRIKVQLEEISYLRMQQEVRSPAERLGALKPMGLLYPRSSAGLLLDMLQQLLEHLPIPLMLQTNSGRVLAQNTVWQRQIGALGDPGQIWQEAAQWLGEMGAATRSPTTEAVEAGEPTMAAHCHLGDTPDMCVCVCPLKDGHEQVLQFVKIPLGRLLPDLNLDWIAPIATAHSATQAGGHSVSPQAESQSPGDRAFQLAALTTDTDQIAQGGEPLPSPPLAEPTSTSAPAAETLWLVLAQDLTEQQHLAKELTAKNADLVQLNRLKDEFLACISHELKTPLTAVLGLSSLLKDQTLGALNQRQVHYAQLIHQSSRHLMAVVNDILDLTRIETGQLDLIYDVVPIQTVCQRAFEKAKQIRLSDLKANADLQDEHLNTQFSLEIEPGLDLIVADDLRLRQMLVHLLSNSLKFTEVEQPIGLRVNRWGGWIAFTVWDTGIGIAADKQHLIFQKFQQLENPLTRQFEGVGLGLVLTRRLARLHGGDVTFISKEGQGSQFTILMPPRPPEKTRLTRGEAIADTTPEPSKLSEYPSGRVPLYSPVGAELAQPPQELRLPLQRSRLMLIVEAVPAFVETLTHHLTGAGYRVAIARSGTEALEKARRLQPCVIFLNPALPTLSGWDVLTLLKSNSKTHHIPVVITATGLDAYLSPPHHVDGFLSLPVQAKELQQTLQHLLLGGKQITAKDSTSEQLTILHLYPDVELELTPDILTQQINQLFQAQRYRILESHDLEQAELLARVWRPDVVLLSSPKHDPTSYLRQLSYLSFIASLPLVTLDQHTTQAANQIPGLLVFPCLSWEPGPEGRRSTELSTLQQVIQIAAGYVWRPLVLAVDVATLPLRGEGEPNGILGAGEALQEAEWLQALKQYLHTSGLRGSVGRSWSEVLQQVASGGADVLVLCWTVDQVEPDVAVQLEQLAAIAMRMPIVVLDHRPAEGRAGAELPPLPAIVHQLARRVLSAQVSMTELLQQLQQVMETPD